MVVCHLKRNIRMRFFYGFMMTIGAQSHMDNSAATQKNVCLFFVLFVFFYCCCRERSSWWDCKPRCLKGTINLLMQISRSWGRVMDRNGNGNNIIVPRLKQCLDRCQIETLDISRALSQIRFFVTFLRWEPKKKNPKIYKHLSTYMFYKDCTKILIHRSWFVKLKEL